MNANHTQQEPRRLCPASPNAAGGAAIPVSPVIARRFLKRHLEAQQDFDVFFDAAGGQEALQRHARKVDRCRHLLAAAGGRLKNHKRGHSVILLPMEGGEPWPL